MSGLKYSEIELEKETKACQKALSQISVLEANILSMREKVKALLCQLPDGVKDSFSGEIQKVKAWQAKNLHGYSERMNSAKLEKIVKGLQDLDDQGREDALKTLIEIKEIKRDKKARELIGRQEVLRTDLNGMKKFINKWKPREYEKVKNRFNALSAMIEKGDFVEAEGHLNRERDKITRLNSDCVKLDAQDMQRRYVLKALRKVCKEMGWGEEAEPRLEEEHNPGSSILYEVETYSSGKMTFLLSLEEIRADSPITSENRVCYKEFDNLSDRLKKFGVKTKFERIESSDEPELLQRGELDLPDEGIEIGMER